MNLRTLRVPIIVIVINFLVFAIIPADLTGLVGDVIYNVVRISMMAYAGWLVVRNGGTLRLAALVGLLLFTFDHVVLKGGWFLLDRSFDAFLGVLISFVMWFLLPVLAAVLSGWAAQRIKGPTQPV